MALYLKQMIVAVVIAIGAGFTTAAQDQVVLKFANADVHDVLALFERLTEYKLVTDNQVVGGRISLSSAQPVSKAKAIELIEQSLFANEYSIIQLNSDTLRITGLGRDPRNGGIPLISKPEDIPNAERLISYVIKLQNRQPEETFSILQRYAALNRTFGAIFIPDPSSRSIIVTERSSIIRNLLKLMREIDVKKHE